MPTAHRFLQSGVRRAPIPCGLPPPAFCPVCPAAVPPAPCPDEKHCWPSSPEHINLLPGLLSQQSQILWHCRWKCLSKAAHPAWYICLSPWPVLFLPAKARPALFGTLLYPLLQPAWMPQVLFPLTAHTFRLPEAHISAFFFSQIIPDSFFTYSFHKSGRKDFFPCPAGRLPACYPISSGRPRHTCRFSGKFPNAGLCII